MSWLCRNPDLIEQEWNLVDFVESDNEAVVLKVTKKKSRTDDSASKAGDSTAHPSCAVESKEMRTEAQWCYWLEQELEDNKTDAAESRIHLMLGAQRSELCEMPFSENRFTRIKKNWNVHGSIARVINRNLSCAFDTFPLELGCPSQRKPTMIYNLRTSAAWEDDRALSITFYLNTLTTKAVWYGAKLYKHDVHGYSLSDDEIISKRLSGFDGGLLHPMLLPTIFADFERDRQIPMARDCFEELVTKVITIPDSEAISLTDEKESLVTTPSQGSPATGFRHATLEKTFRQDTWKSGDEEIHSFTNDKEQGLRTEEPSRTKHQERPIHQWVKIGDIRNGLEDWRAQLIKMIDHTDELENHYLTGNKAFCPTSLGDDRLMTLIKVGKRIKVRLRDLVNEYDEAIRNCTTSMEGMSLAMQLELTNISRKDALTNHQISLSNFEVANRARRDGNLMKIIALLGMIYLPGTFVSGFFSMDFFQWIRDGDEAVVSPFIWLYAAVTIVFTLTTVGFFYCYIIKTRHRGKAEHRILPV